MPLGVKKVSMRFHGTIASILPTGARYGKKSSAQVEQFASKLAGISVIALGAVLIGTIIDEEII